WFSWNPENPDDPIDRFLVESPPENAVVVHCTYRDNPFCPAVMRTEAERLQRADPDPYAHAWLGEYNQRSDARVLGGKVSVQDFEPLPGWDGPYHGVDFGFAQDPMVLVRCWVADNRLWVERESYRVGLELDHAAREWSEKVPGFERYVVRGDAAAPQSISY